MERTEKNLLLERLKTTCLVRGDERAVFPKGEEKTPKRDRSEWMLDFRRAFLNAETSRAIANEFWNAYESKFPFQIAAVEMGSVPFVWFLLAEGLSRGKSANALIVRKSRKKDGLCNIVEWIPEEGVPTVLVDDIVNSGRSLLKALLTAKNEGITITECFCLCNFENPGFPERFRDTPFERLSVRSLFSLSDFGVSIGNGTSAFPKYSAWAKPLFELPEAHLGLVVPKSSPLVSDGALYVAWEGGTLAKIDLESKKPVWTYSMEKTRHGKNILSSVRDCGEEVCFWAYDGAVHFVNKLTGARRAAVTLSEWIWGSPECDVPNDRAFVWLEHAWEIAWGVAAIRISNGQTLWESRSDDFVHASPAYCRITGSVYCGTNGGEFKKFDADSGNVLWKRRFDGAIKIRPTVSPDWKYVFFGCFDGMLRCLDSDTWKTAWEYRTPFSVYSEAIWTEDGLFIWCSDKNFYHFDKEGSLLSKTETFWRIFAKPSRFRETFVVFGSNDGEIRFYDVRTKKTAFSVVHSERVVTEVSFSGTRMYFEDFANRVWEFDLSKLSPAR